MISSHNGGSSWSLTWPLLDNVCCISSYRSVHTRKALYWKWFGAEVEEKGSWARKGPIGLYIQLQENLYIMFILSMCFIS